MSVIEEIKEALEKSGCDYTEDALHDALCYGDDLYYKAEDFKILDQEGGGEGGAEDCEVVFQWRGKFYKIEYWYRSHCGYSIDLNDYKEVKPKVVERTIYV